MLYNKKCDDLITFKCDINTLKCVQLISLCNHVKLCRLTIKKAYKLNLYNILLQGNN